MASLGQLTAGIAHEINNPAGAIFSANELTGRCVEKIKATLKNSQNIEEARNCKILQKSLKILGNNMELISIAGKRVITLMNSLKNFSQLDKAEIQTTDIHEGINSSLNLIESQLKGKIEVKKTFEELPKIRCYPGLLNQVFMNILRNSIQSISQSGTIQIKTHREEKSVCIEISDTGRGIAPNKLDNIFDFHFSRDQSRVKMGSGLPSAYRIVQKHGGSIKIESRENRGTSVFIQIPIK